uniref:Abasic site processing protein n=1 Tax=uncultured Chloroflexota bacterium TaxID=166587 RepID=H5SFP7_9CHLR|nr:hypothetical conserved protein [uncultured Chloroflexota bacterium]
MCGRFTLTASFERLQEAFPGVRFPAPYFPRFNIAPGQSILMIEAGQPAEAKLARWGFLPSWANPATERIGPYINARAETAPFKPAFRAAWRSQRCLIPADGFYEWQKTLHGKQPWYFCRRDRLPFAFAGLWEIHQQAEGESLLTCLILTVPANDLVRAVHERMPLILSSHEYEEWLYPPRQEKPGRWARPSPSEEMICYRVAPLVNRANLEGPELIHELGSES